jgi:glycerol-3-phosphate dehydrogenase subunit C
MTTTYDPFHPKYFDQADLRQEMDRVYDLCHGCRRCFKFCPSFPTLFEFIDAIDDQDSSQMTPAQQDQVVDGCFNCKLCYVNCPYIPGQHEWELDFPRLMLRAKQVLHRDRDHSRKERITNQALGRADQVGTINSAVAPVVNKALAKPGSLPRRLVERVVGISAERVLAPYARTRFSTWFGKRVEGGRHTLGRPKQADAILFPTCLVEYQDVAIGQDLVKVCERNGIACELPEGEVCCGAPFLHQGDVEKFRKLGEKNVRILASAIRRSEAETGAEVRVVVPQPTCSYVLKYDYTVYLGGADAELVADRTRDAAEFLMELHNADASELDTEFSGSIPDKTTYHAPCHLRAQNVGLKSRDLMNLTGTKLAVVAECSGVDGTWGLRAENMEMSRGVAKKMATAIDKAGGDVIAGDCSLANGGIVLETGQAPVHPVSFLARAYGIPRE